MLASSAKRQAPSSAFCDQATFLTVDSLTSLVLLPGVQVLAVEGEALPLPVLPPQAARTTPRAEITAMFVNNDRFRGDHEKCIRNHLSNKMTTLSDKQCKLSSLEMIHSVPG